MDEPEEHVEPGSGTELGTPGAPLSFDEAVATHFPHGRNPLTRGFHLTGTWTPTPTPKIVKEKPEEQRVHLSAFDRAAQGRDIPAEAVRAVPPYGWINHHTLFSRLSKSRITVEKITAENPDGKSFVRRIFFGNEKNRERVLEFFMSALEHDFSFATSEGNKIKFSQACCYAKNKKKDGNIELFFDPNYVDSFKHLFAHKGAHGDDLLSMLEFLVTQGISGDLAHAEKLANAIMALSGAHPKVHRKLITTLPEGTNGSTIAFNATWMEGFFNNDLRHVAAEAFKR